MRVSQLPKCRMAKDGSCNSRAHFAALPLIFRYSESELDAVLLPVQKDNGTRCVADTGVRWLTSVMGRHFTGALARVPWPPSETTAKSYCSGLPKGDVVDFRQAQADILAVLADSPIASDPVAEDIKELVRVGQIGLAFDTLCSWLYEDALPISRPFHKRLVSLAWALEEPTSVDQLGELVVD